MSVQLAYGNRPTWHLNLDTCEVTYNGFKVNGAKLLAVLLMNSKQVRAELTGKDWVAESATFTEID